MVAASAGNHAQGVAFAARELGIKATIFMPVGVALPKLQATRNYGADVILRGHTVDEPLRAAAEFAETYGAVLIPPFDHPFVVAGQGTLGLEILDQVPDLDTVIVPIGGGGLISGVASALKQRAARDGRQVRVIGVQAANAAAYPISLAAGVATEITITPTIADGIAVSKPGMLNFEIIKDTVDQVVTVTDDDTARALLVLLERAKLVVEPAGAVAVAAILTGQVEESRHDGRDPERRQHRPARDGAGDLPRPRGLRALPEDQDHAARPPRPARQGRRTRLGGERERGRGAAHPARPQLADHRGRTRTQRRDPWTRSRARACSTDSARQGMTRGSVIEGSRRQSD